MNTLFHAYVIGGDRESARGHIEKMLVSAGVPIKGNPDYVVTEHVSFSIDNARDMRGWQELGATGERKVRVVFTDFITHEAENALLKTLEEPVAHTHIIFALPNPDVLLPTLLSRVRVIISPKSAFKETAKDFFHLSRAERLAFVTKLAEKGEDEEAAAQVREQALGFVNQLETHLAGSFEKNKNALAALLKLKKYLYLSGASSRMILETLALIA